MNFIQQAYKGDNHWYLYLLVIFIVLFGWQFIGVIPLAVTAILHSESTSEFLRAADDSFMSLGINKNLFLFMMVVMFAVGLVSLFLGVKYIHKRAIKTVITSRNKIDWNRFWFGFFVWGILSVLVVSSDILLAPENYTWNFKPLPFFTLMIISFLFLPIQTSFEELLFRGYFMQGLGTWFKNRWVPLIVTSVAFGLLHGANPEVEKLGYISMVFYIGTGFFFGITTLMDEGTELALGLHAINNIVAAFLVTTDWTVFQTDALFVDTSDPSVGIEMFLPVFVLYPLMLLLFSKKYGWKNWKEKLFGNIEKPVITK
ncbi:CPBP family intramembrane glutamic endopeptidase [Tenacibaculum mesophilum]|uniref:CPBP family intramembrane metalloprotease n=1 Tax=Tenacibaculum sp. Pbs-1 TaxID=3238748 RepID=A0AB33KT49_9FLAO|nr:CPBP family intramembrane glutamic endopeptidase [Tenacibaculum mesophilum]GFD81917.1 abortive infection protein [Tenacibaculum sp. KUL118]GFD93317.1 abortive infection protein [Alteromonas sp. KUL154]